MNSNSLATDTGINDILIYIRIISKNRIMATLDLQDSSIPLWKRHFWGRFVGLGLLSIGVAFYLIWSILYGTWTDIGLYSFTIVLVVFGLLELWLVQEQIKQEDKTSQKR